MIECSKCKITKTDTEFYLRKNSGPVRRRQPCKTCASTLRRATPNKVVSNLVSSAKYRALQKNLEFDISTSSIEHLIEAQNNKCALTGWELEWTPTNRGKGKRNPKKVSLDRINSSVGYVESNIQLVCDIVNMCKRDMTEEELLSLCEAIICHHSSP